MFTVKLHLNCACFWQTSLTVRGHYTTYREVCVYAACMCLVWGTCLSAVFTFIYFLSTAFSLFVWQIYAAIKKAIERENRFSWK